MAGLKLTKEQVCKLWSVGHETCGTGLDVLLAERFLQTGVRPAPRTPSIWPANPPRRGAAQTAANEIVRGMLPCIDACLRSMFFSTSRVVDMRPSLNGRT